MRPAFYDNPEYKKRQAEIIRSRWQEGAFDAIRVPLQKRNCENPRCQKLFSSKAYDPKVFCSRSCAASARNLRRKYSRKISYCLLCGDLNERGSYTYCSNKCQATYAYQQYIDRWKRGIENGNRGKLTKVLSEHIRRYLREKYGSRCSQCGWDTKHQITGVVPLEIDHIDGDWQNNKEENLRVLCPNCHALTSSFRNLNKGNGRGWRRNK